ncbi:MAG: DUF2634 domain-containing protein [Clostridiales bacterium]|nr:DUF2634 domain-containing protein [Clostridiales bacterium]
MRILPIGAPSQPPEKVVPRAEEWAWDFKGDFLYKDGRMYKVYDDEAIKVWIWKLFKTERQLWTIHSLLYGTDYYTLIGLGYTPSYINALAEKMTRDALAINLGDYVLNIEAVDSKTPIVAFAKHILYITFYADTIYNERGVRFGGVYNAYVR